MTIKDGTKKASLKFSGYVPALHVDAAAFAAAVKEFGEDMKILSAVEELVLAGMTVKLTPSKNGERVYVEIGGTEISGSSFRGKYLISFGGTLLSALAVALYRHFTMYGGEWPDQEAAEYG